jgi:general secretion pathway protein H
VLAVVAMLAAILLPRVSRETSRPRLEGYAIEAAAILKADRTAAMKAGRQIATNIDANLRSIRSGATGKVLHVADDVVVTALLPERCNDRPALSLRNPHQLADGRDRNCSARRVLSTPAAAPASRSSKS